MKILRSLQILTLFLAIATSLSAEAEKIKILGVGNSFTMNANKYLAKVFDSVDTADALIGTAHIGGCSLERHVKHMKEHEADPSTGKQYQYRLNWEMQDGKRSLKEMLLDQDWDYITIQQVSTGSYKEETFYPYADELIAYIREYCPNAEIVVHETWSHSVNSYRAKDWKVDPDDMYAKLHANYHKLADKHGLRVIPVGTAFQNARATELWDYQVNDFDIKNPGMERPNLPDMSKSLNNDYYWKKDKEGNWAVHSDGFHANAAGEYLGALCWFEFFSGQDARTVPFVPEGVTAEQAESLRNIAHETVMAEKEAQTAASAM